MTAGVRARAAPSRRAARGVWLAIGLAVLVLPALPLEIWVNAPDQKGPLMLPQVQSWGIGLLVVLIAGLLLGRIATRLPPRRRAAASVDDRVIVALLAVALASLAALVNVTVFSSNPHLVDEVAQLFHARILASGRIAAPLPVPPEAFLMTHTGMGPAGWVSQYPPGQTVLFALGLLVRAEWLVNPLLGGLSVMLIYCTARGLYGRRAAFAAAVLWTLSAWVLFMSSSFLNHVGGVTFALLAWALVWSRPAPGRIALLGAGLALAATAATRPLDGIAAGLPILAWILLRRRWRAAPWMALGGLPVMLAWFWFNWRAYGGPLELGYTALYGESHGLGFHRDPWGEAYTPLVALSNMTVAIRRLHIYLYEWPIPALLPFALWALFGRQRAWRDLVVAVGVAAVPLLYFFYWHSGFYLGPRFYYAAAPCIVIAMGRGWCQARARARRATRPGGVIRWDAALAGAAAVVVVWGGLDVLPRRVDVYRNGLLTAKLHPERELERQGIRQALVIVPESFGSRTMVTLWGMGISPSVTERAYRWMDTCDLWQLVLRARAEGWSRGQVESRVEHLIATQPRAGQVGGWPDPTTRLNPGQPADVCQPELRRDLVGFSIYGFFAWRNAPALDRGVVFARDLFERNAEYFPRYQGWELWRLAPPPNKPGLVAIFQRVGTVPAPGAAAP